MNAYIAGYGIYIPRYRIKVSEIASVWGKNPLEIEKSLGIREKAVAGLDEDAVTIAYEAASRALRHAGIEASAIEACLVGSESHPYAVNPTSTIVAEFLGVGNTYLAADLQFACKAATSGMIALMGLIKSSSIKTGMVIGSDTAQSKPHDVLEYTSGAAGAAYILGCDPGLSIARIIDYASFSSDTPDFWRRDGVLFPSHGGRFTGEPAYFAHVQGATLNLLKKTGLKPEDFHYCVFHMPNGKFPREAARRLGFSENQQKPSLIVDNIGNPYSASSLTGLAATLDIAKPGDKIFFVSYGSGAGSDAFVLQVSDGIAGKRDRTASFSSFQKNTEYISYTQYLRLSKKI